MLSNVDLAPLAIPDFVAGFVYGMTGDNNLTEIEACFTGGEVLAAEIETGIADIKKGGWNNDTQAALNFALAALQIPQELHTCTSMGDDIAALEDWASIFTNPTALAAKVSKNFLFHKTQIKADIAALEGDWSTGNYFRAGVDFADLATVAIGPVKKETLESMNLPAPTSVADFMAGLMYGLTGDNHLEEIETCMQDGDEIFQDMLDILAQIKAFNPIAAAKALGPLIWDLPDAFGSCTGMGDDIAAIEEWATIFKHPIKLTKTVSANWLKHGVEVKDEAMKEQNDWAAGNFFEAGQDTANALVLLMGPIQMSESEEAYPVPNARDVPANFVPEIISGFVYGLTGDNWEAYFNTCYVQSEQATIDLNNAINTIAAGGQENIKKGIEMFVSDYAEFRAGFDGCTDATADIDRTINYLKNIKTMSPTKRFNLIIKAWTNKDTKAELTVDWKSLKADYDAGDYFGAGDEGLVILSTVIPESTFQ